MSIAFSFDGTMLASACEAGEAKLWDLINDSEITTHRGHADTVNDVVFSPDDATLATASDDGTVKIWEVNVPSGNPNGDKPK